MHDQNLITRLPKADLVLFLSLNVVESRIVNDTIKHLQWHNKSSSHTGFEMILDLIIVFCRHNYHPVTIICQSQSKQKKTALTCQSMMKSYRRDVWMPTVAHHLMVSNFWNAYLGWLSFCIARRDFCSCETQEIVQKKVNVNFEYSKHIRVPNHISQLTTQSYCEWQLGSGLSFTVFSCPRIIVQNNNIEHHSTDNGMIEWKWNECR